MHRPASCCFPRPADDNAEASPVACGGVCPPVQSRIWEDIGEMVASSSLTGARCRPHQSFLRHNTVHLTPLLLAPELKTSPPLLSNGGSLRPIQNHSTWRRRSRTRDDMKRIEETRGWRPPLEKLASAPARLGSDTGQRRGVATRRDHHSGAQACAKVRGLWWRGHRPRRADGRGERLGRGRAGRAERRGERVGRDRKSVV